MLLPNYTNSMRAKLRGREKAKYSIYLSYIFQLPCNIITLNEAEALTECFTEPFRESGDGSQVALCGKLDMVHDHSKAMAALARKSVTRPEVKIIYDASHPTSRHFDFENDPSVRGEKVIWFMIAEVSFGYKNYEKT